MVHKIRDQKIWVQRNFEFKNTQLDNCPNGQMSNGQLSRWTFVWMDDCPGVLLSGWMIFLLPKFKGPKRFV